MPNQDDRDYHRNRQRQEVAAAAAATDPAARRIHETLAQDHGVRADLAGEVEVNPG